ncbi:MAG: HEPN domain-containing protein [Kiritimatiellae bacterium]|jgi:uncharacterized protein (UPF0332 family)|nr:HEPN domain-containing protein [Kiritimatiellia bacterium]HHU14438.1 HEPN domain-containing protein [Lentisphaerota bacterium]HOF62632.1 HEPN domain-containing protein [Candidatus Latescibacterota bacterium]MDD2349389.1 HEPN domain-containing protein [Kiritimatiellia bacterium]MDD3584497.1 HEPN domain-containing protein [Kiritimatiellia bacterium]
MTEFITGEKERARLALEAARAVLNIDPNSAANRTFYAAFHAFTAFFASRGQTFTRHATLRNAIHRDLILTGELPTSIGKDFDFLMDMRDSGDYGGLIHVSLSDAQAAIETADRILSTVIPLC